MTQKEEAKVTVQTLVKNCSYNDLVILQTGQIEETLDHLGQWKVYLYRMLKRPITERVSVSKRIGSKFMALEFARVHRRKYKFMVFILASYILKRL